MPTFHFQIMLCNAATVLVNNKSIMEFQSDGTISLSKLPEVTMILIFSYLPLRDKINAKDVCCHWNSVIRSSSSLWKRVSIDGFTPYRSELKRMEIAELDGNQLAKNLSKFILKLANTTDLIQSFSIHGGIGFDVFEIRFKRSLHNLLIRQRRLLSLKMVLPISSNRFSNQLIFDIVEKHQNTLECLSISDSGISMEDWLGCLTRANFPNLKSISYPWRYSYDVPWHYKVERPIEKSTLMQCFEQTLKRGKMEEINMDIDPESPDFHLEWSCSFARSLKSQIKQGRARNLRKILLDSLSDTAAFGFKIHEARKDAEILIRNCPHITHLKCYDIILHSECLQIQGEPFINLVRHYSSQLVMLECAITDDVAAVISNSCSNLSSLIVLGEDKLSDKGLLALSKLSKLQHLHLIIEFMLSPATPNGIIKLLTSCISELETLKLELPFIFFMEDEIYDVICRTNGALRSLKLNAFDDSNQDRYYGHELFEADKYVTMFVQGLLKIVKSCPPMTHFSAVNEYFIRLDEIRNNWKLFKVADLLDSIERHQSRLETLELKIRVRVQTDYEKFLIDALPYCEMIFSFNDFRFYYPVCYRGPQMVHHDILVSNPVKMLE